MSWQLVTAIHDVGDGLTHYERHSKYYDHSHSVVLAPKCCCDVFSVISWVS
jgi:hypothetical protein